jgi:hypothetical protein
MPRSTAKVTAVPQFCGPGVDVNFIAGQNTNIGTVNVNKDFTTGKVYVTYTTTGNWYMTTLHLYVGKQGVAIPAPYVNKQGSPSPGQFPYSINLSGPAQTYTFEINNLDGTCFTVAAHADVSEIVGGKTKQTQTGWAAGVRFVSQGNWATKFDACIPQCGDDGNNFGDQ